MNTPCKKTQKLILICLVISAVIFGISFSIINNTDEINTKIKPKKNYQYTSMYNHLSNDKESSDKDDDQENQKILVRQKGKPSEKQPEKKAPKESTETIEGLLKLGEFK